MPALTEDSWEVADSQPLDSGAKEADPWQVVSSQPLDSKPKGADPWQVVDSQPLLETLAAPAPTSTPAIPPAQQPPAVQPSMWQKAARTLFVPPPPAPPKPPPGPQLVAPVPPPAVQPKPSPFGPVAAQPPAPLPPPVAAPPAQPSTVYGGPQLGRITPPAVPGLYKPTPQQITQSDRRAAGEQLQEKITPQNFPAYFDQHPEPNLLLDTVHGVATAGKGVGQIYQAMPFALPNQGAGPQRYKPTNYPLAAEGFTNAVGGAMEAATPTIGAGLAAAPVRTGVSLASGYLGSKGTEYLARKAGVDEAYIPALSLAGGVAAGGVAHNLGENVDVRLGANRFPVPKPFEQMTDPELVSAYSANEQSPPKNYNWVRDQIVQEVGRRQASRGVGVGNQAPPETSTQGPPPGPGGGSPPAAPPSESRGAPSASVIPPSVGAPSETPAPPQEGKPLWEMTRDEIEQAHQEARTKDQQDLVGIFGEEGAKRYQQLTRTANGTSQRADAAAAELGQMEAGLTDEQRRRLYGQDQSSDAPSLEDIQGYRRALGNLDPTSAADLGASLKWAITRVGYDPDPANMDADQRVAYATIREAYRIAHERGFDPVEVSRAALTAAWGRYPDPEDAEFMLEHFLNPAQQQVQEAQQPPTPPQAAVPPPVGQAPERGSMWPPLPANLPPPVGGPQAPPDLDKIYSETATPTEPPARSYDEVQRDIDAAEDELQRQGRPLSDVTPEMAELYRERFAIEKWQDAEMDAGIHERLADVIPDEAQRQKLVTAITETDRPTALRFNQPQDMIANVGRVANEVLQFAAQERQEPEHRWNKVRAVLAGTPDDQGIKLELQHAPGYDPISPETIDRAQEIFDALMAGDAPQIPGGTPKAGAGDENPIGIPRSEPPPRVEYDEATARKAVALWKRNSDGHISPAGLDAILERDPALAQAYADYDNRLHEEAARERQESWDRASRRGGAIDAAAEPSGLPSGDEPQGSMFDLPAGEVDQPQRQSRYADLPPHEIHLDPVRLQFKQEGIGQKGVTDQFKDVVQWDPDLAGTVHVWRDPADGKIYVVNGHHRVELAQRLVERYGPEAVPEGLHVRFLSATTAAEARAAGALINIAEGNGTPLDIAKYFRDSGRTPEEIEAGGKIKLKPGAAQLGAGLSKLAQPLFDDVVAGVLPVIRGAIIGANVPNLADQRNLYDLLKARERAGRRMTDTQLQELIRLNASGPTTVETSSQGGLFGEEEMARSLLPEKAEVSEYVRKQLAAEKKLFGAVGTQAAAERLEQAGNVIKASENAEAAERANQGIYIYDQLSRSAGPIDQLLNQAAQEIADGQDINEVKRRAYTAIREEVQRAAAQYAGRPQGPQGLSEGNGGSEELRSKRRRGPESDLLYGPGELSLEQPTGASSEEIGQPASREIARFQNREEGTYAAVTRVHDGYQIQLHDTDDGAPLNQPAKRFSKETAVAHAQDLAQQTGLVDKAAMRDAMERAQQDQAEREQLERPRFGAPVKPKRLKPPQQGGLFDEGPTQEGLGLSEAAPEREPSEYEQFDQEVQAESHPYRQMMKAYGLDPNSLPDVTSQVRHDFNKWQSFDRQVENSAKPDVTRRFAGEAHDDFQSGLAYVAERWGEEAAHNMAGQLWGKLPEESQPEEKAPTRAPEKRGTASARNIAIADLEALAAQRGLTPQEQDELTGLRRQRAERMADRRTKFEREQAPLFAEQVPEAKPEDFIRADEDRARGFRELHEKADRRAQDYREAVAGAVTPEQLAEMDKKWESFKGPHTPTYHASYWTERYRETFHKNPSDVSYVVSDAEGVRNVYGGPWPRPKTEGEQAASKHNLTEEEYLEFVRDKGKEPEPVNPEGWAAQPGGEGGSEMQARRAGPNDSPPPKRSVPEVQQALHNQTKGRAIKADAPDAVKLHRVKSASRRELQIQLSRGADGEGWYADDTQLADNDMAQAFPELKKNPARVILIKAFSASTSGSHEPQKESNQAARIYSIYRNSKTGRVPLKNPKSGNQWVGQGATVALVKIQRMLDHFGAKRDLVRAEERLANFLMTNHDAADIQKFGRKLGYTAGTVTKWIEGRQVKGLPMKGAVVLGNKFARYFAGIAGITMDGTPIDIWMARMHYRQLGTLLDANGEPAGMARGVGDRRVFMQAHEELGREVGLEKEAVQSLLWHFEQELYRSMGASTTTGNRSTGTLKYLEDNGIAKSYTSRRRRQLGLGSGEGEESRARRGTEVDDEGAVSRGAGGPEEGRGPPEAQGDEVAARKPRSDSGQLNLFGEDSLTREQVDQAVQNPRSHIVTVDPSQYAQLPNPQIRDAPPGMTFQEYVIENSQFQLGAPDIQDVPVILTNDPGMDVLLMAKGTWQGGQNDGRTTAGIAIRPREWKAILDAEVAAVFRRDRRKSLPVDGRVFALAAAVRKVLGMPTLAQQIQNAGGPGTPGVLRKVQGEWDHPVHSRKYFIVANSGYHTGAKLKGLLEEEYDHIQHMRLPGGFRTLPYQITETHPLGLRAAKHLEQNAGYYPLFPATHANQAERIGTNAVITSEILVRLMRRDRWQELGLTAQERLDLAWEYIKDLRARGGDADAIIDQIHAAIEPTETLSRRSEAGYGPTEEVGAPPGTRGPPGAGEDVSGREREEASGEFRALAPRIRKVAEQAALAARANKVGRALGIGPTIERQVIPRINDLEKATDQILYTFNPAKRGSNAEKAALSTRANTAHMDRIIKQASIALEELRKPLGKLSQNQRWKFIIRSESNKPQTDAALPNGEVIPAAEMDRIAGVFRKVNDYIRSEVQDADGPANQRIWRDVFWPNMWKETSNVKPGGGSSMPSGLGKSPLAGPRNFEKRKVFDTFMDGVRAGYTPLYDNPVDYWQAKTREMAKFAMLTRLRADLKPLAKFVGFTEKMPDGYDKVKDPFTKIFQYSNKEKGFIARGDWVYPKEAARIINNYLSPDPRQTMPVWKMITDLGNLWLRWKLTGFYHFGATALNGIYSHAALAARMAAAGDMKGAAEHLAKAPISPVADVMRGRRLHKQFLDINGTQTAAFKALEEGGFRAGQDPFYAAGMRQRFREAWRAGERIMPIKGLAAATEMITVPLMEHYVPYMKMAAAHDLARFELERYQNRNAGMMPTPPRLRKMMADAVDSVDNRFGQLTYDNLFWNRMLKAALMSVVMSVGWNLGTVRELGGGIKDILSTGVGKGPGLSNKVAYLAALIALHTLGAGIYQKLATGKNPSAVKDIVFPQDGGTDERGHPTRVSFPDYMKELWNWLHDPVGSAINKSHPMLSMFFKYINNRDYWGSKIQNFEDDWKERVKQVFSSFTREEGLPLSGSNLSKMKERSGQPWGQFLKENAGKAVASQFGFSPTPAWIGLTPAEKLLAEYQRERQSVGGRDVEEAQRTTARAAIVRAIRLGEESQPAVENALRQGLVTGKDLARLHKAARFTPLQSAMSHDMLNPGEIMRIWEAANPEERKQIEGFVKLRLARLANKPNAHWSDSARGAAEKYFGIKARPRLAIPPGAGLPPAVGANQ